MIESTFTLQYGGQRPTWKLTLTLDPVILFIYLFLRRKAKTANANCIKPTHLDPVIPQSQLGHL